MKKRHALVLAVASFLLGFASLYSLGFMPDRLLWISCVLLLGFGLIATVRLFTASGRYALGFGASYAVGFVSFFAVRVLYIASNRELFAFLF